MFGFTKSVCLIIKNAIHFYMNPTVADDFFYPRNGYIHSVVIFRMASSLFVSFPPSIPAHMAGLT